MIATAAQFARSLPDSPARAAASEFRVRFVFSLRGEAPEIVSTCVKATSEADAIRAAITGKLGRTHGPLHSLQMLGVFRIG